MLKDLTVVLERYPAAVRPLDQPEDLGNAGGLSGARFWRYRSGTGTLLVRAWPTDGPPLVVLERIHGWLAELTTLGFVPVPIAGLDGRTIVVYAGQFWEVGPWMPGVSDPGRPPTAGRVRAACSALAAFHARLRRHATVGPSCGILARLREVEALSIRGFAALGRSVAESPNDRIGSIARRWLEVAPPFAASLRAGLSRAASRPVARQPCLRDARPEHFLFEGDRVSGLVDFGAMGEDSVAADLARLGSDWLGHDRLLRAEALRAYSAVRPLDHTELDLIAVFEETGALLIGAHWMRWHFLERRRFNDPGAVVSGLERGLDRLLARLCPGGRALDVSDDEPR